MSVPRLLLLAALLTGGCTGAGASAPAAPVAADDKPDVRALSFPAGWLVARIGGEAVRLTQVSPAGEDPPSWQPPADVVAGLAAADLIVANGAGYEAWLATVSLPESKLLQSAAGVDPIRLPGLTHSHGDDGSHSHAGIDPHTWMDPVALGQQAVAVHARLIALDPAHQGAYDAGLAGLRADLDQIDKELAAALAPAKGRRLAASHPAFNHLARRYGLDLTSFAFDPTEAPDAAAAAPLLAWLPTAGADPILLWEVAPSAAVVAALPAGLRHVLVDPVEQPGSDGVYDYLAKSRTNVAVFAGLFAPADASPGEPAP